MEQGVDLNAANHLRWTALYLALESWAPSNALLLIESGAGVDVGDRDKVTPVYIAFRSARRMMLPKEPEQKEVNQRLLALILQRCKISTHVIRKADRHYIPTLEDTEVRQLC